MSCCTTSYDIYLIIPDQNSTKERINKEIKELQKNVYTDSQLKFRCSDELEAIITEYNYEIALKPLNYKIHRSDWYGGNNKCVLEIY